jgi:hypothetical protein
MWLVILAARRWQVRRLFWGGLALQLLAVRPEVFVVAVVVSGFFRLWDLVGGARREEAETKKIDYYMQGPFMTLEGVLYYFSTYTGTDRGGKEQFELESDVWHCRRERDMAGAAQLWMTLGGAGGRLPAQRQATEHLVSISSFTTLFSFSLSLFCLIR